MSDWGPWKAYGHDHIKCEICGKHGSKWFRISRRVDPEALAWSHMEIYRSQSACKRCKERIEKLDQIREQQDPTKYIDRLAEQVQNKRPAKDGSASASED